MFTLSFDFFTECKHWRYEYKKKYTPVCRKKAKASSGGWKLKIDISKGQYLEIDPKTLEFDFKSRSIRTNHVI